MPKRKIIHFSSIKLFQLDDDEFADFQLMARSEVDGRQRSIYFAKSEAQKFAKELAAIASILDAHATTGEELGRMQADVPS